MDDCGRARALAATVDTLRSQGRLARAVRAIEQVGKLCPAVAQPLTLTHAQTLFELGQGEKARAVLASAPQSSMQGASSQQAEALSRAIDAEHRAAASDADTSRAMATHRDAAAALHGGQPARAAAQYLEAWKASPDRLDWLVDAALAFRAAGDLPTAQRWFDRAQAALTAKYGAPSIVPDLNPDFGYSYINATVSPDWRYVVTASGDEVAVHDILTWHRRMVFKDRSYPKPVVARMSPDGSVVAIGNTTGLVQVVDAATGALVRNLPGHTGTVLELAFSHDGTKLVTASEDKSARLWDVGTGKVLHKLPGHTAAVRRSAFLRDGSLLVTTSEDGSIRVWNPGSGQLVRVLSGHRDKIRGLDIRPDGTQLATSSEDKTVRLWELATGKEVRVLRAPAHAWRVAFSPDGTRLAAFFSDNTLRVFDPSTGQELQSFKATQSRVDDRFPSDTGVPVPLPLEDLRLASLGGVPILGGSGGGSTAYSGSTIVVDVMYRPDGKLLAFDADNTARNNVVAKLWDVDADRTVRLLGRRDDISAAVAFDRSATRLATGSRDGRVHVWSLDQPRHQTGRVGRSIINTLAFVPGDKDSPVVVGNEAGEVYWIASLASSDRATRLGHHPREVMAVALSADGSKLASVSRGNDVMVFETNPMKRIATFPAADFTSVSTVAFSPDGSRLVVGSSYEGIRIFETSTGKPLLLSSDRAGSRLMAFTPDGARLALLSWEGVATLVDPSTGKVLQTTPRTPDAAWLCSHCSALLPTAGSSACLPQRQQPDWVGKTHWRLTTGIGTSATGELVAAEGVQRGVEVFRPGQAGVVFAVSAVGGTDAAIAMSSGRAEIFGDAARSALVCMFGAARMPLEVCEDTLGVTELVPRTMRGEALDTM